MSPRLQITLDALIKWEENSSYINLSAETALNKCEEKDKAFITALLYGTVERKITLDYIIAKHAKRSIDDIGITEKNILRLALYQILYMNTPDHAAVDTSVGLAKKSARGFINAVLRDFLRTDKQISLPPREKNEARYLSVKHSFPAWICKLYVSLYGYEEAEALLSSFNGDSELVLRVNTLKTSRNELIAEIGGEKSKLAENAIILKSGSPSKLYGFKEGLFFVQDIPSQLDTEALAPTENSRVIDVCACPGGKSFGMAMLMKNKGEIFSFDIHESKLSLIESGARRLGISIIKSEVCDATLGDTALFGTADFVMCDAPCSGLGVLGKKSDLRYKNKESADKLPELQLKILTQSTKYLKDSGYLVYSTCTVNPAENEGVINSFLAENTDFELVPFKIGECTYNGMHTFKAKFFISKLRKKRK